MADAKTETQENKTKIQQVSNNRNALETNRII